MRKLISIFVVLLMTALSVNANITVTDNVPAQDLVNAILGSGITASNIIYTGTLEASGTFVNGLDAGINIDSGILLTTGSASYVDHTNTYDDDDETDDYAVNNLAGDSDLDAIVSPGVTYDATVLEFDFTSAGGELYFKYVFASEEYNKFVNSEFNDVFAFFLDGTNIALIPGTTTPVSINTVNGGNPFGVDATNPELYNNNDLNDGGSSYAIEYNGFTDVFTATAELIAGETYHIKLAIADTSDWAADSGVFIQAGSFSDVPTPIPAPGAFLLAVIGLAYSSLKMQRRKYC